MLSFKKEALNVYDRAIAYLDKWFDFERSPLKKFHVLNLDETCSFSDILEVVSTCGVAIDGDELYSEYLCLKQVTPKLKESYHEVDKRWVEFFRSCDAPNLKRVVEYVLSIPISNAHVERIFSMMKNLWTDERNRLRPQLVKAELCVKVNFDLSCSHFFDYDVSKEKSLLKAARNEQKYFFKKSTASY